MKHSPTCELLLPEYLGIIVGTVFDPAGHGLLWNRWQLLATVVLSHGRASIDERPENQQKGVRSQSEHQHKITTLTHGPSYVNCRLYRRSEY